uniref:NR LBD domain-containing protein n=1 Tax=Caenorhabditis tropicalis TaxID=1561998 RepID=A0A1I7U1N8_9PELO
MGSYQQFTMKFSQHFRMESFQQVTVEPYQQFTMEPLQQFPMVHRVPSTHEKSLYESDPSFYYLSNQIERVARENPSKRKLLHDILLQIVLAFDQNNHTNPSSIFDQLKRIFDN